MEKESPAWLHSRHNTTESTPPLTARTKWPFGCIFSLMYLVNRESKCFL
jgi:hypothetical protein